MEAKLIINGTDFSRYIVEGGLKFSPVYRQSRDVVVLDGTMYRAQVKKWQIDVTLVELRDQTLALLQAALGTNPATVQCTPPDGITITHSFYVTDISTEAKTVRGGNTYYAAPSFTLEEQ